ncbi:MAG: hypothetical protein E7222_12695 [Clostridiales bacterium]|nr:hypothetical protein [Clostridiales bacterium]
MPERLDDLYHTFYKLQELTALKSSVEENHKILINPLLKKDRKTVLRIIDKLEMICNYQSKASFIQGFKLGSQLTTELQTYDSRSAEIDSQSCGNFFLPQEVMEDEKEN